MGTHAVRPYNNDGCKSRQKMDTEVPLRKKKARCYRFLNGVQMLKNYASTASLFTSRAAIIAITAKTGTASFSVSRKLLKNPCVK